MYFTALMSWRLPGRSTHLSYMSWRLRVWHLSSTPMAAVAHWEPTTWQHDMACAGETWRTTTMPERQSVLRQTRMHVQ